MTIANTKAAEALSPMLDVFHSIIGETLQAVWHVYAEGSLDRLVLDFGSVSLIVLADENDDSIDILIATATDLRKSGTDASHLEPWNHFIGKPFG